MPSLNQAISFSKVPSTSIFAKNHSTFLIAPVMSIQLKSVEGGRGAESKSLVPFIAQPERTNAQPERLIVDEMGSEMITLYVGPGEEAFAIHKNLLCATGKWLSEFLNEPRGPGQKIKFGAEDPQMFKLFVESLYTKIVPGVPQGADRLIQSLRLKNLCQLYAFTERYMLDTIVRNKVMDSIQDGFLIVKKLPESGLVTGVYRNTKAGSKLRTFAIRGVFYGLRIGAYNNNDLDLIVASLRESEEMMCDFLNGVQTLEFPERDPRIRDCGGEADCVECIGLPGRVAGVLGTWPCAFHVHRSPVDTIEDEPVDSEVVDTGCYLWNRG